jgi:hypothetical protein
MDDSVSWQEFLSNHPELGWEPFVSFAERASWGKQLFNLTIGEGLSWTICTLSRTQGKVDRLVDKLAKAGWVS